MCKLELNSEVNVQEMAGARFHTVGLYGYGPARSRGENNPCGAGSEVETWGSLM